MASVYIYELIDPDGDETGEVYRDFVEAQEAARKSGCAVSRCEYEYADQTLVWTPDGSEEWPPTTRTWTGTIKLLDTDIGDIDEKIRNMVYGRICNRIESEAGYYDYEIVDGTINIFGLDAIEVTYSFETRPR